MNKSNLDEHDKAVYRESSVRMENIEVGVKVRVQ